MRSLYFLAQSKNLDRFSQLFDRENIIPTVFDTAKVPALVGFVMRDKAIAQQDFILLDVGRMNTWSSSHILSAVQNLRRFSSAKLIFLGEPCEELTELYGILASRHNIDNLVTDSPGADIESALQRCFSLAPKFPDKLQAIQHMMTQEAVKAVRPVTIPQGLTLQVAVAGTMPRSGVSTQAFAIHHYLSSLGFHPAIYDRTDILPALTQFESHTEQDGYVTVRNIPFCSSQLPQFNAYIMDLGSLTPENAAHFSGADLSILVGCTKPWELSAFADALKLLFPYSCRNLITLANGSTQQELESLSKYFGEHVGIAPHCPDLWQLTSDTTQSYAPLFLPCLKEICGRQFAQESDLEVEP